MCKIRTSRVQNTRFPCAKYTLPSGILPCLPGNARSPEPHRLQHVPAAEDLATQVPSHLPCAKYAHPVYKIHASRVQNTHFHLESSPAFPVTRAVPSHTGCNTYRRQKTWQLKYLHTSRVQNTHIPCTKYTLPVCKIHTSIWNPPLPSR